MEKQFDYAKGLERLKEIALLMEDPGTPLQELDRYLRESEEISGECRAYLRTIRENHEKDIRN